jgi:hypothetical protein
VTSWLIPTATIVVSLVVALVQYAHWRTANQKVVIDLYDRRLKVYEQIETSIRGVMREGSASNEEFYQFAKRTRIFYLETTYSRTYRSCEGILPGWSVFEMT